MSLGTKFKPLFILCLSIILLDVATKEWVSGVSETASGPSLLPYVIIANFCGIHLQITHAVNTGAAWGVLAEYPHLLVLVRLLLISALIIYLVNMNRRPQWNIPLCLIIGGALGNVVDYFRFGYVIDMIQFRFWGYDYPVFNIADSAIFIGSFWILCSAMMEKSPNDAS